MHREQENRQPDSLYSYLVGRRGLTLQKNVVRPHTGSAGPYEDAASWHPRQRYSILCVSPDANKTNANVNGHCSRTRAPVTLKSGFPHLENGCRAEGLSHRMCKQPRTLQMY